MNGLVLHNPDKPKGLGWFCWHRWSKWEPYTYIWNGTIRRASVFGMSQPFQASELRQRRTCVKCGKMQDVVIER